jgi:hypothetical protein
MGHLLGYVLREIEAVTADSSASLRNDNKKHANDNEKNVRMTMKRADDNKNVEMTTKTCGTTAKT